MPLEESEIELFWQILDQRGSARLRLAAAIGVESGLRIGEVCRLRLQDIDVVQQKLFVRLPNKTNRERWAFFSHKTKRYYIEWMTERRDDCNHDGLLHNEFGNPLKVNTLMQEYRRVLCKTYKGKKINETGWDQWSTHRLRHTFASRLASAGADANTVMVSGGWNSYEAMTVYVRTSEAAARRGYEEAMRRSVEQKKLPPHKKTLTPAELLQRKRIQTALVPPQAELERCV